MPDVNLPSPFEAYAGEEPFVFVSYAHKDGHLVYPAIKALHDSGVRIWFDGGIDPGNEWAEDISKALEKAHIFLVFITPAAVESNNVRDEIGLALSEKKTFVAVHLQETQLPGSLKLRMSRLQAILKYRMTEENYNKKLLDSFSEGVVEAKKKTEIEMVLIPAGKFLMGSPEAEEGRSGDEKQHEVIITKPYYMGKYAVTQEVWESVMGNNPSRQARGAKIPVTDLSWRDCWEFIKNLNAKTDGGYRLPTEAEWEYACRAGKTTVFSFGNYLTMNDGNFEGKNMETVGSYKPNEFGLYDMHGNVWECCEDWYRDYPEGSVTDPKGPATGIFRVLRGGAFDDLASKTRSSNRFFSSPSLPNGSTFGFRLARTK